VGRIELKQSVEEHSSVEHLHEMTAMENGMSETLAESSRRRQFDWAWVLWLNRRQLGRWMGIALVISTVIAFLTPKEFESTTRLVPSDSRSRSGSGLAMMAALAGGGAGSLAGSALGGVASDMLGLHDGGAVFVEMLRSRTLQDRIVERFDLRKVYGTRYWEDARKMLMARTLISPDRKSSVITVTYTDRSPQRAAQITQAYVEELDRIAAEVNTSAARREREFIEQRLKSVKQDLDTSSRTFSEYASKNATLDLKDQGKAMVEAAAVLQGQLIAAQSELEGLEQIYTGSNVRVRMLRARVDELQRQLKKVGGNSSNPNFGDSTSDQEFPSIRQLPLLGVRWADLYRETKIQETVYALLTEQYEQAKIDEARETPVVKVLDAATVPERKASPHRLIIMVLGTLMALCVSSFWVLGKSAWQEMDSEDPRKQLGQEIGAKVLLHWSRVKVRVQGLRDRLGPQTSGD
jgi:capsule polysaccharide export protein KpsE/RkpR